MIYCPGVDADALLQARFRHQLRQQARFETISYPGWRAVVRDGGGFERFVELSCSAVLRRQADGPLRLTGYSFGAIVALALAVRLRACGRPVAWLAVLDTDLDWFAASPELGGWSRAKFLQHVGQIRSARGAAEALRPLAKAALGLTARPLLGWLATRDRARPLPFPLPSAPHLSAESELRLERRLRLDLAASWLRRSGWQGADIPVVLFRSEQPRPGGPLDLGWSAIGRPVSVHPVPGDHVTMLRGCNGTAVAASFARALLSGGAANGQSGGQP